MFFPYILKCLRICRAVRRKHQAESLMAQVGATFSQLNLRLFKYSRENPML